MSGTKTSYTSLPTSGIVKYYDPWEAHHLSSDASGTVYSYNNYGVDFDNNFVGGYNLSPYGYYEISTGSIQNSSGDAVITGSVVYRYQNGLTYQDSYSGDITGRFYGSNYQGIGIVDDTENYRGVLGLYKDPINPTPTNPTGTLSNSGYAIMYNNDGSVMDGTLELSIDRASRYISSTITTESYGELSFDGGNANKDGMYFSDDAFLALNASGTDAFSHIDDGYFGVFTDYIGQQYQNARAVTDLKLGAMLAGEIGGSSSINGASYWVAGTKTPDSFFATANAPSEPLLYQASLVGLVKSDGTYYNLYDFHDETTQNMLTLSFDFQNDNFHGEMSLNYGGHHDSEGNYIDGSEWIIAVAKASDSSIGRNYYAILNDFEGWLDGSFYGDNAEAIGGIFKIESPEGKMAYGAYGGTVDPSDMYIGYTGVGGFTKYILLTESNPNYDGTYFAPLALSSEDAYFAFNGPNISFYGGGQSLEYKDNYNTIQGNEFKNVDVSASFGIPSSTYTGGIVGNFGMIEGQGLIDSDTDGAYYNWSFMADSMQEYFLAYQKGYDMSPQNNQLTQVVAFGKQSVYDNLPTDGIYSYAEPDLDASYSPNDPVALGESIGTINWRSKAYLSVNRNADDGSIMLKIGRVGESNGYAIIEADSKNFQYESSFSPPTYFNGNVDGFMFGSNQQGLVVSDNYVEVDTAGTTQLNIQAGFQDLNDRQTSSTPSGTSILEGYTASAYKDTSLQTDPFIGIGSAVMILDRDNGLVEADLNPDTTQYGGHQTYGSDNTANYKLSSYIRDDFFAALPRNGGTLENSNTELYSTDTRGYMIAMDTSSDAGSDYVSWGYWAMSAEGAVDNANLLEVDPRSMWIAGEPTPQAYIDTLVDGNTVYNYSGDVMGTYFNSSNAMSALEADSNFNMEINFGTGLVGGTFFLKTDDGDWDESFTATPAEEADDLKISKGKYEGTFTSHPASAIQGRVYGPNAEATGGSFAISDSSKQAIGVFKGKR